MDFAMLKRTQHFYFFISNFTCRQFCWFTWHAFQAGVINFCWTTFEQALLFTVLSWITLMSTLKLAGGHGSRLLPQRVWKIKGRKKAVLVFTLEASCIGGDYSVLWKPNSWVFLWQKRIYCGMKWNNDLGKCTEIPKVIHILKEKSIFKGNF